MRSECAWCGKWLGDKPGPEQGVTHGICDDCAASELAAYLKTTDAKKEVRHDPS